jgi:4-hydroxy-tetrahydrodipicolinate reductase
MNDVEIIEYHHNKKADAPSGTALKTAELIQEKATVNTTPIDETETVKGARGGRHANVPIHSVRLPGVIANQDVILGGDGETLTLSHRSLSRECFMPGVLLCIRKSSEMSGLVYGLENLLSL